MGNQSLTATIAQLPPLESTLLTGRDSLEITISTRADGGAGFEKKSYRVTVDDVLRIYGERRDNPNKVTAEQVGAYTIEEILELLEGKLGVGAVAVDSERLGGMTRQEIVEEIRQGTVKNAEQLGGIPAEGYVQVVEFDLSVEGVTDHVNALTQEITLSNVGEP